VHLTNSWEPAREKEQQFTGQGTSNTVSATFDELDFEYATSVAEKAMRSMAEQRVPPTPNNFHVWFNYVLGTPPVLKRAIDILIGNKRRFDTSTNREIYASYVGSKAVDETVVHDVSQQLHSVMASARQFLTTAIADNRTQMAAISDVSERTEAGLDPKILIESLMSELAKAATRATRLEASFMEKSRELDTIRDSLIKSEERAKTDTLTGLPNRLALEEFFRTTQLAAMEQGEAVSALLIDIDHFKRFNDEFGHGVGDQVLRLMARVLRERVREIDLPARYGGEELIVVLPGADLAAGTAVAERIRRSIAECHITRRSTGEALPGITISIGVAQFQGGESMADLIDRCDRALYLAKKTGRNRVVSETELEPAQQAG
jgi:diguanylate cyclase